MYTPLVIFDLGGTLVSGPAQGPADEMASRLGLSRAHKRDLFAALMATPFAAPSEVAGFLDNLAGRRSQVTEDVVAEVWARQTEVAEPIREARSILESLQSHRLRFAVISNIWPPFLQSVRVHFGDFLDECVDPDLQLFSFRVGFPKPSTVMFRQALEIAGTKPAESVMIGDSYVDDMAPSAELGIRTIWLLHRPHREVESLAAVINGDRPRPSQTLVSIDELDAGLIEAVLAGQSHR
ncbi:HAD family hydrolase [Krasilnikovia sp. M28-CT-15]|uniref:HAD family hydrolase n=1 Tax=Krasilnikovia sp. M28-CT-15 TaxID=3373540 RepID=UPI00399C8F13